jgi:hypothetical protein
MHNYQLQILVNDVAQLGLTHAPTIITTHVGFLLKSLSLGASTHLPGGFST